MQQHRVTLNTRYIQEVEVAHQKIDAQYRCAQGPAWYLHEYHVVLNLHGAHKLTNIIKGQDRGVLPSLFKTYSFAVARPGIDTYCLGCANKQMMLFAFCHLAHLGTR